MRWVPWPAVRRPRSWTSVAPCSGGWAGRTRRCCHGRAGFWPASFLVDPRPARHSLHRVLGSGDRRDGAMRSSRDPHALWPRPTRVPRRVPDSRESRCGGRFGPGTSANARSPDGSGDRVALGAPLLLPGLQVVPEDPNVRCQVAILQRSSSGNPLSAGCTICSTSSSKGSMDCRSPEAIGSDTSAGIRRRPLYVGDDRFVVLAVTGGRLTRRRRPEVVAFGFSVVAMSVVAFVPSGRVDSLPVAVGRNRACGSERSYLVVFGLAALAGVGNGRSGERRRRTVRAALEREAGSRSRTGLMVGCLWVFGRGELPAGETNSGRRAFIWPAIGDRSRADGDRRSGCDPIGVRTERSP